VACRVHSLAPVKWFHCERCGRVLSFENSQCNSCQSQLGYVAEAQRLVVLPDTQAPGAAFLLQGFNDAFVRCRKGGARAGPIG
jgi:hypothetical protein